MSQRALTVWISVSLFVCVRTGSALSLLYGTSATLEHHHFNHAVMILQSEVNDVPISTVMQAGCCADVVLQTFLQHLACDLAQSMTLCLCVGLVWVKENTNLRNI